MTPAGYMYKTVAMRRADFKTGVVRDIYSASSCISSDFCDWTRHWKHNGFWLFNSTETIRKIAAAEGIDLSTMTAFYYRAYPAQWDRESRAWIDFAPDAAFHTAVVVPTHSNLEGFDVVTYSAQTAAECSPLSCNRHAETLLVNAHCLFETFEGAKAAIEAGALAAGEPGPYRIMEVNTL